MSWGPHSCCGEGVLFFCWGSSSVFFWEAVLVMGNRSPLHLSWIPMVALELQWWSWESSQGALGGLVLILNSNGERGVPLE